MKCWPLYVIHNHTLTCADLVLSCFKIHALKSPSILEQNSNISRSKPDKLTYKNDITGISPVTIPVTWAVLSNHIIAWLINI